MSAKLGKLSGSVCLPATFAWHGYVSVCIISMTPVQSAINTRTLFSSVNVNPQMPDHLSTDARILHAGPIGNDEHHVNETSRTDMHT